MKTEDILNEPPTFQSNTEATDYYIAKIEENIGFLKDLVGSFKRRAIPHDYQGLANAASFNWGSAQAHISLAAKYLIKEKMEAMYERKD